MGKAWHLPYDYWRASWREGDAHPWEEVHPYMAVAWSLLAIFLVSVVANGVYNVYFHPLSKFPGPKWAASYEFPYLVSLFKGVSTHEIKKWHEEYGPVVRFAPRSLSFNTAQAWKDIYATKHDGEYIPKDEEWFIDHDDKVHIIHCNDSDHSRIRRSVHHAFSESALREQEPLLQKHCDVFVRQMRKYGGDRKPVNFREWFNFFTFDTIGDLSLGEDFRALESGEYHFWVRDIFTALKMWRVLRFGEMYSLIGWLLNAMIKLSPHFTEKRDAFFKLPITRVEKRLERQTDRKDFMSYIKAHYEKGSITKNEMIDTASVFITGGSETTGTLLCGLTYFLLTNPTKLDRLQQEIRGSFQSEAELTIAGLSNLKYLDCCLNEALRMYPPASSIFPRRTTKGCIIDGNYVPPGIAVGVHQFGTYRSARNFADPDSFEPERWLPDAECPEKFRQDNRAAFQPFQLGPRGCIGRNLAIVEFRMVIAHLIWNFDMKLREESKDWIDQKVFLIWDKGDLLVELEARETKAR